MDSLSMRGCWQSEAKVPRSHHSCTSHVSVMTPPDCVCPGFSRVLCLKVCTRFGCEIFDANSASNSDLTLLLAICSITLTATAEPIQRPLYTLPKEPAPM